VSKESIGLGHEIDVRWIPVKAAADLLEVSRQRVDQLCREGVLVSIKYAGTNLVSVRSCDARKRARQVGGGGRGSGRRGVGGSH